MMGRSRPTIVKVMRVLGAPEETRAIAYAKGGRHKQTLFLAPDAHKALGDACFAYFEAELVAGKWWLGAKIESYPTRNW